jgi:hypothetical protein
MVDTSEIKSSDLSRYRELIATIDMPADKKDEVIVIVRRIMQTFVDLAFQKHSAQHSLQFADKDSSREDSDRANVGHTQTMNSSFSAASRQRVDSANVKGVQHDPTVTQEGSHLLPR